ncbi:uncharacterized protein LOC113634611 isoform X2 [Tachysurus fulvidraco]|uniref:uncharacterized protein LOC113634611 isoform X2 n=1 Tax=Tachysurus fulvidraco TaxID=1234273 RepID=UPI000F50C0B8|nr:uncharacterized protein LOC113634611 isoform X2 [Tachysurus fulvidraco]
MQTFKTVKKKRVRFTTSSPQTCPLQRSPSVASGDAHIASSNPSECAPEVLTVEVQHILRRRGPAVPPTIITGPNVTSGIAPEILVADGDHLTRGRGPTPLTVPTNSPASKKTPRQLASTFHCRTDAPFIYPNDYTEYQAAFVAKENRTFLLPPKMCHAPQTLTRQAVKNKELEPSVVQQRKTFGNALDHNKRHAPARPTGSRKKRVLQPVQQETVQCILPHGACVDASWTEWVTNYKENFYFSHNACSSSSPRKSAPRPPSNLRKLRPATQRTEYQAAFGPKVLSAKFDFRLFIQLHGNGSK